MEHSNQIKIYKKRNPQTTSLWKLLNCHFVDFEECYDQLFQKKYGFYRLVISRVVRKYIECGDLHQGFARIKCPDCHHQFILALACGSYCTSLDLCVNFRFLPLCSWSRWFIHAVSRIAKFFISDRESTFGTEIPYPSFFDSQAIRNLIQGQ